MRTIIFGFVVSFVVLTASSAAAQNQGQAGAIIQQQPPAAAPPVQVQTSMGALNAAQALHHDIKVNVLTTDTFVVVKDVGDSQIVIVYRVDQAGKTQLLHKARFYY